MKAFFLISIGHNILYGACGLCAALTSEELTGFWDPTHVYFETALEVMSFPVIMLFFTVLPTYDPPDLIWSGLTIVNSFLWAGALCAAGSGLFPGVAAVIRTGRGRK